MVANEHIILSCKDLYKSFKIKPKSESVILANISLDVYQGDFITILGQSGGGKSTLLKLLGGFLNPSSGNILFDGQPLKGINPKIGMIFQEHNLYPWLNVEQNISFGFRIRDEKRIHYACKVKEIIEQVGLSHAKKLYPHQLSGGMRQRVAIARSITVQPDILLLDEPFSALDVQLRRRLQDFLLSIWRETSTTMVLVTHNVEEAILLGQKLIVIGDQPGRLIETINISHSAFSDRYHLKFLQLQRYLETTIEKDMITKNSRKSMSNEQILINDLKK